MTPTVPDYEITWRPERPEDQAFCFALYCSTRTEEVESWGWPPEMRQSFLALQFRAQGGYRNQYPGADFEIILHQNKPVGRFVLNRAPEEFRLVDLALLPEYRNHGWGGFLLRRFQAEAGAAGKPLRLSVLKGNRAARLYERLGFRSAGGTEIYDELVWNASN